MLHLSTLDFLKSLKKNNDRQWFEKNKKQFETAKNDFAEFVQQLIAEISKFDKSIADIEAKDCIFRIYRDVRFSKDKLPYKTNTGASIVQGGKKSTLAGYYFQIEPDGNSFLAGGMYMPSAEHLQLVRQEIDYNTDDFKKIIHHTAFKKHFGELWGEKLKTAPRNYPKDHPNIELLKHKHFVVVHNLKDEQLFSKNFLKHSINILKEIKPLNDFLNTAVS